MIKTEYDDNDSADQTQLQSVKRIYVISYVVIIAVALVGLGYFIVKHNSAKPALVNSNNNGVSALPLGTPGTIPLSATQSNQSSDSQSSISGSSLGSSSINLQNNQPSNNAAATPSSLQSTGQTINPNLPY